MSELVTLTGYAKLRGLAKSTISRQLSEGKLGARRPDGLIDVAAADQARRNNLSPSRVQDARARKAARVRKLGIEVAPADSSSDARLVAVSVLKQISAPVEVLAFAKVAVRAGCSKIQAFVLALWFGAQPSMNLEGIYAEDLRDFKSPTEAEWREVLGQSFDFEAADLESDRVTMPEILPTDARAE